VLNAIEEEERIDCKIKVKGGKTSLVSSELRGHEKCLSFGEMPFKTQSVDNSNFKSKEKYVRPLFTDMNKAVK
jgi:hypothetical protein